MREVSVRELRNRTSEVMARVESGEALTLTVRGRPVADIVPHGQRRDAIPSAEFFAGLEGALAGLPEGSREPWDLGLTSDDLLEEVGVSRRAWTVGARGRV